MDDDVEYSVKRDREGKLSAVQVGWPLVGRWLRPGVGSCCRCRFLVLLLLPPRVPSAALRLWGHEVLRHPVLPDPAQTPLPPPRPTGPPRPPGQGRV